MVDPTERRGLCATVADVRHADDKAGPGDRSAVLIAGMHRSGTSALTRVLNILGCDLPRQLLAPGPDNHLGFWESHWIVSLNDEILASAASSWSDWRELDQDWYASSAASAFCAKADAVLAQEYGETRLLALKDPRIGRLMRFWTDALERFGCRLVVVCPIRNPLDVAASLTARNGIPSSVGLLLWLRHVLDAEVHSRRYARCFVRYERLLDDPQGVVDDLGRALGVPWPNRTAASEADIHAFLSKEFRHHRTDDARIFDDPGAPIWVQRSFEIFDRWCRGDVRHSDRRELDRIRSTFNDAASVFSKLVLDVESCARQAKLEPLPGAPAVHDSALLARHRSEYASAIARMLAASARIEELEASVERVKREVETHKSRTSDLEEANRNLRRTLQASDQQVTGLRATIDELRNSTSWRISAPLRWLKGVAVRARARRW